MTGISELFSGRLSVVYDVGFGHVCSAVLKNHGSRASVLVAFAGGDAGVHAELYVRVLCAPVSMHDT